MKKNKFIIGLMLIITLSGCSKAYSEEENIYYPIGDSITWLDGNKYANSNEKAVGYTSIIENKMGFDGVINKGISGASLAKSGNYPSNGSVLEDNEWDDLNLADTITIFVGTNDFKLDVPIGELNDDNYSSSTFIGSYQKLLDNIKTENPVAKIYLITPLQRDNDDYDINTVNKSGHKLIDYVNSIKKIGEKYNLEVIDLYNSSVITMNNLDDYTVDGLHPNKKGFEIVADEIIEYINQ